MEQVAMSAPELASSSSRDHDEDLLSDDFRMSCMKVVPCSKRFVHDWTECPFAHPQEKARRRDPKLHTYTGIACPSMKKEGSCAFGDHCPYAHNVFEYWLHPTRYRTQLCNDGSNCRRKICFFAHSLDELRVPACKPFVSPEGLAAAAAAAAADNEMKRKSGLVGSPMANLNMAPTVTPARASIDSIRQSSEWGPAAMPSVAGGSSNNLASPHSPQEISPTDMESPVTASQQQQQQQQQGSEAQQDVRFSAHEQQVIEAVTNMLAEDKLSAPQAATILQQMLPANSLQLLQSRLGFVTTTEEATAGGTVSRKASSDPAVQAVHQMHPHQDQMMMASTSSPRGSFDMTGAANRQSMESARSSFDTARYSFDGQQRLSSDTFTTPRGSLEGYGMQQQQPQQQQQQQQYGYAPPAPAYPQEPQEQQQQQQRTSSNDGKPPLPPQRYWTGQQLTTVPEGLPMINTPHSHMWGTSTAPVRHSTGSIDTHSSGSGNLSAAGRLSADLSRMSFEEADAGKINPYSSAFFSGGNGNGSNEAAAQQLHAGW